MKGRCTLRDSWWFLKYFAVRKLAAFKLELRGHDGLLKRWVKRCHFFVVTIQNPFKRVLYLAVNCPLVAGLCMVCCGFWTKTFGILTALRMPNWRYVPTCPVLLYLLLYRWWIKFFSVTNEPAFYVGVFGK